MVTLRRQRGELPGDDGDHGLGRLFPRPAPCGPGQHPQPAQQPAGAQPDGPAEGADAEAGSDGATAWLNSSSCTPVFLAAWLLLNDRASATAFAMSAAPLALFEVPVMAIIGDSGKVSARTCVRSCCTPMPARGCAYARVELLVAMRA